MDKIVFFFPFWNFFSLFDFEINLIEAILQMHRNNISKEVLFNSSGNIKYLESILF